MSDSTGRIGRKCATVSSRVLPPSAIGQWDATHVKESMDVLTFGLNTMN